MADKPKTYFDAELTDSYVTDIKTIGEAIQKEAGSSPVAPYFQGGRSTEFYKGMLAGSKAYMAIMDRCAPGNFETFSHVLLDLQRCIAAQID